MFVCFDCGDGFKTNETFLKHSCDAEVSSFETNFVNKEQNISAQVEIESYQRENATVNDQKGGYIKCPMNCKKLFPKDQFLVPIALGEHVMKSHKNEENSELYQKIVNQNQSNETTDLSFVSQTPSTLNCEICGTSFTRFSSLKNHLKNIHYEGPPTLNCDMCGKSFTSNSSLNSHLRNIHSEVKMVRL